jgi:hypothetical protein
MEKGEDFIETVKFTICLYFFIATWISIFLMNSVDNLLDVLKYGFLAIVCALMFIHFAPIRLRREEGEEDDND